MRGRGGCVGCTEPVGSRTEAGGLPRIASFPSRPPDCRELESAKGSGFCRAEREGVGWGLHVFCEDARGWGEGLHGDGRCVRGAGGWQGASKGWGLRGAGVGVALLPSPAAPGMPRLQWEPPHTQPQHLCTPNPCTHSRLAMGCHHPTPLWPGSLGPAVHIRRVWSSLPTSVLSTAFLHAWVLLCALCLQRGATLRVSLPPQVLLQCCCWLVQRVTQALLISLRVKPCLFA